MGFAVDQVVLADGSGCDFPGASGRDGLGCAIGKCQFDLREQPGAVAVILSGEPADMAAVPAVAEDGAGGVGPRAHQAGHVVSLILHPLGVVGPAGGEDVVADAPAVEVEFIEAERRGIEAGADDFFAHRESRAEIRAGRARLKASGESRADPRAAPVAAGEQAGFPEGVRAFAAAVSLVPRLDPPPGAFPRNEGTPAVGDLSCRVGLDPAAVPQVGRPAAPRGDADAVGGLTRAAPAVSCKFPAQPGSRIVHAERIDQVVAAQLGWAGRRVHINEFTAEARRSRRTV